MASSPVPLSRQAAIDARKFAVWTELDPPCPWNSFYRLPAGSLHEGQRERGGTMEKSITICSRGNKSLGDDSGTEFIRVL